jgi:glucose/arabinose dehydrogenase
MRQEESMKFNVPKQTALSAAVALALVGFAAVPTLARADTPVLVGNANCPGEEVKYGPGNGQDIVVPKGYKVEAFVTGLNFPTDIAFVGTKDKFKAYVLESGTGLPGRCNNRKGVNNNASYPGYASALNNPFTPDIVVFDQNGKQIAGPIGKPTSEDVAGCVWPGRPGLPKCTNQGFQPDGPAIGLAFEHNFAGGRLFATDSNQGARGARSGGGNNTSRVVEVNLNSGKVTPIISGLPTGDHPTEQLLVKEGWLYWSQGSATNSGVTGHDNGGGGNQHEIACQQITLSQNVWTSKHSDGTPDHHTSGYSDHNVARPGAVLPPFEDATSPGMCTGAILRARIGDAQNSIEPVAWGFRNPYGIRFSPDDHPLNGNLMYSENGEDERGARPTNNSPDRLGVARQNADGSPQWHGWPDRFGFLDSTQSVFNPTGKGGNDDDPAVGGKPVLPVLAFFPQHPVAPLALEPADVAAVGLDFAPKSFTGGIVKKNAVLVAREGDFGFSAANGTPEAGHDVELVNFFGANPSELSQSRFAFNCPSNKQDREQDDGLPRCLTESEQAFVDGIRGINRPTTLRFGPDGAAYLVDYGAVRDFGLSNGATKFQIGADVPLVQIPGTGVIWRISRIGGHDRDDD